MTLIKTVDSYSAPTDAQIALAKKDGVEAWNGYLPGANIDSTWKATDFARIKAAGLYTLAYASGASDALAMKTLALQWGVKGCLDVERSIRPNGTWVTQWLTDSGFGFYASASGYPNDVAAFHVVAAYVVDDPHVSWPAGMPLPPGSHGWQWCANEPAYTTDVDRSWFDSTVYYTPPVPTPPTPPIVDNEDMPFLVTITTTPPGEQGTWLFGNGNYTGVEDLQSLTALEAVIPTSQRITVSLKQHERWRADYPQGTPTGSFATGQKS